ncbi:MAG: hypothetical protein JWO03_1239 [Bacteroidetes bacterium]|nr:hypothetical protein [Bacteroidota bacterium]
MFNLTRRFAFLLCLPLFIPIGFLVADLFVPKTKSSSIVTEKSSLHGCHIYFKGNSTSVSSEDYDLVNVGDSVILKSGRFLSGVAEFKTFHQPTVIKTQERVGILGICLFFLLPFLIFLWTLITERGLKYFSESRNIGIYLVIISVNYLAILLYVCVKVNSSH